jgi:hypothetical protein
MAELDLRLPIQVPPGSFLTATATDLAGNTSELNSCIIIQPQGIFTDGFESGDTSAWTASVPAK